MSDIRADALVWLLARKRAPERWWRWAAVRLSAREVLLRELEPAALRGFARAGDPARRALISRRSPPPTVRPGSVLSLVEEAGAVGPAARLFDRVHADPGELSEVLHQAIVLDTASGPLRLHTALLAVRRHADEILTNHARAILRRCLNLAGQPVDPYDPSELGMAARSAAAALLARRPTLDLDMHQRLLGGQTVPELALVQAAALQQRRAGYAEGIANAIEALRPDERGALTFGRDCDRQYSAVDAPLRRTRGSKLAALRSRAVIFGAVIGRRLLWIVAAVAFPACGVGIAVAIDALAGLPDAVTVGAGEALTALGILVAVHVLSAELAADRLAGPIAAVTSFPLPLAAGYLAGLALVTRSIVTVGKQHTATASAVTIGLVAALILLVLAALVTLLHRTDPVRAVAAFARRRRAVTLRAGRELGELHKRALKTRGFVHGLPWMRQALDVPRGERRTPIRAPRRGYLMLRTRRLSRLATRDVWRSERARVALVAPIGLAVGADEEVFSVIPAVDASLDEREVRRLSKTISVHRHRRVDAVAEAIGVLLGISASQAALGNQAAAEQIGERALGVMDVHLTGIRAARGAVDEGESVGMIPALRTAAVQALRLHAAAADANSREVLLGFLQRLLELTDAADGFAATLAFQLGLQTPALARPTATQLLWDCGCRALETDDATSRRVVGEQIARVLGATRDAIELSGRLVQFAAATQPQAAELEWARHLALAREDRNGLELTGIRAGATALWIGDASLAMMVALALRGLDVAAWRAHFEDRNVADSETLNSELYGQLLGPDPQRALQDFVDFTGRITGAVATPGGSTPDHG